MYRVKKRFFKKLPRAQIYLSWFDLAVVLTKLIFLKLNKGEKVLALEKKYANYFKTKSALALPRARIALYYLLKNLSLAEGSEVIMTPLTIADMVNMVRCSGLKPVFCDLGKNSYNIDYHDLEKKITHRTKVLFITHLNGLAADMGKVMPIVEKHKLILIEDCSQSFGAKFKDKYLGTFGRAGIFSLSFLKNTSTLFGGMIISNDIELIEKIDDETSSLPLPSKFFLLIEALKNIIFKILTNRLVFSLFTYYLIKFFNIINRNLVENFIRSNEAAELLDEVPKTMLHSYTDIQAALGLKLLKHIDSRDSERIDNFNYLTDKLSPQAKKHLPRIVPSAKNTYWRLPLAVKDAGQFIDYLFNNNVDSATVLLVLCNEQEEFKEYYNGPTPNAYSARYKSVLIPFHTDLNSSNMDYLVQLLNNYFK